MRALLLLLVGGGFTLDQNHPSLEDGGGIERSDRTQERQRRQLDFEGGGGGVNDYVNGEADFDADPGVGDGDEQEFWRTVGTKLIPPTDNSKSILTVFSRIIGT